MKHATGLQKYEKDACVDGEEFWNLLRVLVSHFTISPNRNEKLLKLQELDYEKEQAALGEKAVKKRK